VTATTRAHVVYQGMGMAFHRQTLVLGGVLAIAAVAIAAVAIAGPRVLSSHHSRPLRPFGHACTLENGVRFCPSVSLAQRVRSFDGVPLDVDVTLPAGGTGPFPTIVMLHGWDGDKTTLEASSPAGDGNESYDYNNAYYAQHGYAVLNYSARGWGESCGVAASRADRGCAKGWIHLADQRYEARDTQYLLGLLVDERIARAGQLAVTGISYGAGQSIELAYLRDRVRLASGAFERWRSPAGTPLAIDAAWARWPWSDLVDAQWPNGRFLDTQVAPPRQSREPIGIELQDWLGGLLASAEQTAFVAPSGSDATADVRSWYALLGNGEPYASDAAAVLDQIYSYHQGYGLPGKPAPLLLQSGWTDSLLPVEQSLRVYNAVRAQHGQVALQLGDLGHPPADNKQNSDRAFDAQGARFFAAELTHHGAAPASSSVSAYTLTCPASEAAGGPYTAASWSALHHGSISFGSAAPQSFTSAGGDPTVAAALNPITGTREACQTVPASDEPNTATYTTTSRGFTLLGITTVTATIGVHGRDGEIAARLWDVQPGGQQRLIDRGIYRLGDDQQGEITMQLHGDGYRFPAGDTVKLELLGRDAPYYRASNASFSVQASAVNVTLPTG
jgi:X-Pro dipeptidyl-peptidase-like protein